MTGSERVPMVCSNQELRHAPDNNFDLFNFPWVSKMDLWIFLWLFYCYFLCIAPRVVYLLYNFFSSISFSMLCYFACYDFICCYFCMLSHLVCYHQIWYCFIIIIIICLHTIVYLFEFYILFLFFYTCYFFRLNFPQVE